MNMRIGACGITCELCGLFTEGVCGGCTSGNDEKALLVVETQKKKFGMVWPGA